MIGTLEEQKRVLELEKMKRSLELQLQEMSHRIQVQQEQIALASIDPLTGLRNRAGVAEEINKILKEERVGTFMIIDMDNFKGVNDTYGHLEGDRVLVRFANALKNATDERNLLARIGGDEFIVFIPGETTKVQIREKASRIVRRIEREIITPGRLVKVTISMGIARAPEDGLIFEALYTNADKALYSVKNTGKNAFRFYDEAEKVRRKEQVKRASLTEITTKLREKKMEGSFVVDYENFEKIYRFLERNIARENRQIQCVLFTIDEPQDSVYDEYEMQRQMEHLQHAVTSVLRKGDVTTNYSSCQMLTLLMDVNTLNAQRVVERIIQRFKNNAGAGALEVLCEVQQLIPEEDFA